MNQPMRVLHVITRMNVGGVGGFILDMWQFLRERGIEFRVLSGLEPGCEGSLASQCAALGLEIERVPDLVRRPSPAHDRAACQQIAQAIQTWRPDVVHTHTAKAGYLGRRAAWQSQVPAVHHVHGWTFPYQRPAAARWMYRRMEAHAARWCARLLAVCPSDVRMGLASGIGRPEQYEVVPPGIHVAAVAEAGARPDQELHRWKQGHSLVAFIGRLSPQKDPCTFIRAIHELERRTPGRYRYLMVGDGPLRQEVDWRLRRGQASWATRREGFRPDVPQVLGAVDVLVHPSVHEGLPRLLLEAFAVGVPVVGTPVGGCSEVLVDGVTGLTVRPGDSGAICDAVDYLTQNPDHSRRLVARARELLPQYDAQVCSDRLMQVYHRVVASCSP